MPADMNDNDASVLAMLFGVHLGFTTVTPFKLFVLDNAERIARLVNEEMALPGVERKHRIAVQRKVQSSEFKKLSPGALESYRIEAEQETEKNRSFAEAPITKEETFRYGISLH